MEAVGGHGAAGVTDRGLIRGVNADAMALATVDDWTVGVVCDGVSMAPRSDRAARLAAEVAANVTVEALRAGELPETALVRAAARAAQAVSALATSPRATRAPARTTHIPARAGQIPASANQAATSANQAATSANQAATFANQSPAPAGRASAAATDAPAYAMQALTRAAPVPTRVPSASGDPVLDLLGAAPACTFLAGIVGPEGIWTAWIGDSRAYWIPDEGPGWALSEDDTGENDALAAWLGADADDRPPRIRSHRPAVPGRLLLCTDGLWRYLDGVESLRSVLPSRRGGRDADGELRNVRAWVAHALEAGGHDNVTALSIPVSPLYEP
ncbi:PP2C family serine/threonine-protein phosphatase [uncultured Streptomyces sp.]|uniref:PP2C family protein-serine/threonine phosphatase n=1 Tax=uncultured Streptomyces sp. TaxID=174707 RepID=UPI002612F483|nr:protein phosphatase 2C domain-containing protein [uncultured Streptomyces sp.]